ncbi:MAG TPA: chemotaxis protein CheX [Desulfobulbaceae bacterium]|nr:chemotaxis protein CheX [Desulfobulbaceae bacterium]
MGSFSDIVPKVVDATVEIFTGMVMMEINQAGDPFVELGPMKNSITGMIGLAGTHKGMLAVHFPNALALAITTSFLGMDVEEMNEDVQDAIGEIANMLGGNVKTILSDKGYDIQLSLPSTISGEEYTFMSEHDLDQIIIPFKAPAGTFYVELELER